MSKPIFVWFETEGKYAGKMGTFTTEPTDSLPRYMQVKPCPGCDGTGKDNSEPEFECEYCSEGKPGWIIA